MLLLCWLAACAPSDTTSDWMVGRWAVDGQSCDRAWLTFRGDGSWSSYFYKGRWSAEGGRLRLALTEQKIGNASNWRWQPVRPPQCHVEIVERVSGNELRSRWEDGTSHRLSRCPQTPPPMGACLGDCDRVTAFDAWSLQPPVATRACEG